MVPGFILYRKMQQEGKQDIMSSLIDSSPPTQDARQFAINSEARKLAESQCRFGLVNKKFYRVSKSRADREFV